MIFWDETLKRLLMKNKALEDIEFDGMGKTKMGFQSPQEFIL